MYSLKSEVDSLRYGVFFAILLGITGVICVGWFLWSLLAGSVNLSILLRGVASVVISFGPAYWAYSRLYTIRLKCPNCKKHFPAFDPWMCPSCKNVDDVPAHIKEYKEAKETTKKKKEETVEELVARLWKRPKAYAFLYSCPTCSLKVTTFKCHNCSEKIALTAHADPNEFAYYPLRSPGGMSEIEEDSKEDEPDSRPSSKNSEVNAILDRLYTNDEIMDVLEKRKEYYGGLVKSGRMTREKAQKDLKKEELYLRSHMMLN